MINVQLFKDWKCDDHKAVVMRNQKELKWVKQINNKNNNNHNNNKTNKDMCNFASWALITQPIS